MVAVQKGNNVAFVFKHTMQDASLKIAGYVEGQR